MNTFIEIGESLEQAETLLVLLTHDHEKGECACECCTALTHIWAAVGQLDMAMKQSELTVGVVTHIRDLFSEN
jgi:hypothetical protein